MGPCLEGIIADSAYREAGNSDHRWPAHGEGLPQFQTALTLAVSRASMPATDRSKKRKPIYGKRCSSFLRAVMNRPGSIDSSVGKSVVRTYTPGQIVRDDPCRHRVRQLSCADH